MTESTDLPQIENGTDGDSSANESGFAGHLLSTQKLDPSLFPSQRDIWAWLDIFLAKDDGTINSVPLCLRPHVAHLVDETGRLPGTKISHVFKTPYSLARYFHAHETGVFAPPWRGTGARPEYIKRELLAMERRRKEAEEQARREAEAYFTNIYFIGTRGGPVKIGQALNLKTRLSGIQTGNPHKLELLAFVWADGSLEWEYHERFASTRMHGEWFEWSSELEAEIDRLNVPTQSLAIDGMEKTG